MPKKYLVETILWADGNITRRLVEDKGQGAIDWPQDDIQYVSYKKACTPNGGIMCGDCTLEGKDLPTLVCAKYMKED